MLHCSLVDVRNAVELCVIVNKPIDVGEIQSANIGSPENGEVGDVWKHSIDVVGERSRYRVWSGPGKLPDETAILRAGLEHDYRAVIPASVEIEYQSDVLRPRMLIHKGACTKQTRLFSISEESNHIILQRQIGRASCRERV